MDRSNIQEKYKWDTTSLLSGDGQWEQEFEKLSAATDDILQFKGKLKDKDIILQAFLSEEEKSKALETLYVYAMLKHDQDTREVKYKSMLDRMRGLLVKFSESSSFIYPELSKLSDKKLKELSCDSDMSDYDYMLRKIIKDKKHTLSEKEEKLLASGGSVFSGIGGVFSMFNNADIKFDEAKDGQGKLNPMSHGLYSLYLQSGDRALRKNAFRSQYKPYISTIHTLAQNYYLNCLKDWYLSKARGYKSCMDASVSGEDVEGKVYDNLIKSVSKGLPALHRYVALRKKVLKLNKMHMYDMYVPIVSDAGLELEYEDAVKLVKEGLKPLGQDYAKLLNEAFENRWIDVHENKGKRSGAYSVGIYTCHPYVLLNYQKTTHDVFTIAHELGHSLHSHYSNQNQPHAKANYTIFVAEVASTVNEVLLLKHILSTEHNPDIKKYLLSYYLDMFRTTLFRQTMFSEFEAVAHGMVENDQPLSKDNLCEVYLDLNKKYYGKSVVHDEEISYEWARIPHFYRSFYVYKYATGITAAVSIAKAILTEGEPAVKRYKDFLSAGGSDSPVNILKIAGVDLLTAKPFKDAMQEFSDTLKALNELCKQQ